LPPGRRIFKPGGIFLFGAEQALVKLFRRLEPGRSQPIAHARGCFGLSRAAQKQLAGCATRWLFFGCFHKPSGFFCEPFFKRGGVLDPLTLHGAVLQSPGFYNSKNGAGVPSVHFLTHANQATVIFKPGP
jgi:hypothetical protein